MRSDYFQSAISVLSAVLFMASSNSDSLHNELASATDLDKLELKSRSKANLKTKEAKTYQSGEIFQIVEIRDIDGKRRGRTSRRRLSRWRARPRTGR